MQVYDPPSVVGKRGQRQPDEVHSEGLGRIDGFLSPDVDPTTQLGYATNAIREGGFLGVGVGEGTVKWSLPDAHTDFIIAVAAEEYGLILVLVIIALYTTIVIGVVGRKPLADR